jgi:hypothetical protein
MFLLKRHRRHVISALCDACDGRLTDVTCVSVAVGYETNFIGDRLTLSFVVFDIKTSVV